MTNPFLAYADKAIAAPVKRRMQANEKRFKHRAQEKAVQKALIERDLLWKLWKRWRKETFDELLAGKYENEVKKLIAFLERYKLTQENKLIAFVNAGPWLEAPPEIRLLVLQLIDKQIIKLRQALKLPPFDDSMLGSKKLDAFLIIRNNFQKGKNHAEQ